MARPVGQAERFWRSCKRNPVVSGLTAAALLGLLSTLGISIFFAISRTQTARRLATAYKPSEAHRITAQSYAADLLCGQGLSISRQGDAAKGLLRLVRALELAPPERMDLQISIRRALAVSSMNFPEGAVHFEWDDYFPFARFSPNGRSLITAHEDGQVRIWDSVVGTLRRTIPLPRSWNEGGGYGLTNMTCLPDGSGFLIAGPGEVRTWSLNDGQPLGLPIRLEPNVHLDTRAVFSTDGTLILTIQTETAKEHEKEGLYPGKARAWNAESAQPIGPFINYWENLGVLKRRAVFQPNGRAILVQVGKKEVQIFDTRTGTPIGQPIRSMAGIEGFVFSPNGRCILTCELDGKLQLRDAETGRAIGAPMLHPEAPNAAPLAIFSDDGRTILSKANDTVHIWYLDSLRSTTTEVAGDIWLSRSQSEFETGGLAILESDMSSTSSILETLTGRSLNAFKNFGTCIAFDSHGSNCLRLASFPLHSGGDLWSLEPIEGAPESIRLWAELLAMSEMVDDETLHPLDESAWQNRREKLVELIGGVSDSGPVRRLANDPLYWLRFEADLARQAHRWGDAVGLLRRLTLAEPKQWRHYQRMGEALCQLGRYRDAVSAFMQARNSCGKQWSERPNTLFQLGLASLAASDKANYHQVCRELLRLDAKVVDAKYKAVELLLAGAWPPDGWGHDLDPSVARLIGDGATPEALLLIRAGQFEKVLRHINLRTGNTPVYLYEYCDKPLLAILHRRLEHTVEARENLNQARAEFRDLVVWEPDRRGLFWRWEGRLLFELVIREAADLIEGDDAGFPANPFAH